MKIKKTKDQHHFKKLKLSRVISAFIAVNTTVFTLSAVALPTETPNITTNTMRFEMIAMFDLVADRDVTHTSVTSGNWSDPSTWRNGRVPAQGDRVLIDSGTQVTVDGQYSESETVMTIRVDGTLSFASDVDTELWFDTLVVNRGGKLQVGTPGNPIQSAVSARLVVNDINGGLEINNRNSPDYDPYRHGQGILSHGRFTAIGEAKTSFTTMNGAQAGDTTLTLDISPSNWEIGDEIIIASTDREYDHEDRRTITSINGNRIGLDSALQYNHLTPAHTKAGLELKVHVANMTRNVVIETAPGNVGGSIFKRGLILMMHSNNTDIENIAVVNMGRTNKLEMVNDTRIGSNGSIQSIGSNPRARYPLHFHRAGYQGEAAIIKGNVVDGSPGWAYVNHGSNVDITDNVAYNTDGAAFIAERGDERGSFISNLSIRSEGMNNGIALGPKKDAGDFANTGSGFWFEGVGMLTVKNNVATGSKGHGMVVYTFKIDGADEIPTNMTISQTSDRTIAMDKVGPIEWSGNTVYSSGLGLSIGELNVRNERARFTDQLHWNVGTGYSWFYSNNVDLVNLTHINNLQQPWGIGSLMHHGADSLRYLNPYIEGLTVGLQVPRDSKRTPDREDRNLIQNGYFNNLVNLWVIQGRRHNDPLELLIKHPNFGTLTPSATRFASNQIWGALNNDGDQRGRNSQERGLYEELRNRISMDQQVDIFGYLDLRQAQKHRANAVHRIDVDIDLGDGLYRMWFAEQQAGNFVPFKRENDGTGGNPISSSSVGRTNNQLGNARAAAGRVLPGNARNNADFHFGGTIEGMRLHNLVAFERTGNGTPRPNGNIPPLAMDDSAVTNTNVSVDIDVLSNDTDRDGDALSVTMAINGMHGSTTVNSDNTITYTPDQDFDGQDSFTYTISDGNNGTGTATVVIQVGAMVNHAPIAVNDSVTTNQGESILIDVLGNDSDPENDVLTITSFDMADNGTISLLNNELVYQPDAAFTGTDSFGYTIDDGKGNQSSASVTVTVRESVTPPPPPPPPPSGLTAVDDNVSTNPGDKIKISVLANDTGGDRLKVDRVGNPSNGSVRIVSNNRIKYTPDRGFEGIDSFSYTITDRREGGQATATVTVTVGDGGSITPPGGLVANDDAVSTDEGRRVVIKVLDNDTGGDRLKIDRVGNPSNGSVRIRDKKKIKYTPNRGFEGTDSFTYTITDRRNGGQATATVTVTVGDGGVTPPPPPPPGNNAPVANNDSATVPFGDSSIAINVLENDTDADNDALSISAFSQAGNGTVTQNGAQLIYEPGANALGSTDSFSYTISDGNGGESSATVTVTIEEESVTPPPPPTNGGSAIFNEFGTITLDPTVEYSSRNARNVDSLAAYLHGNGNTSVFVTGKRGTLTRFDVDGNETGSIRLSGINGVIVFEGEVYASTQDGGDIHVYDPETLELKRRFGSGTLRRGEHDLDLWKSDNGISIAYVTDDGGRVYAFNAVTGEDLYSINTGIRNGLEEVEVIQRPAGLPSLLIVANENLDGNYGFQVYKISDTGADHVGNFGQGEWTEDAEGIVAAVAADGSGYLFATDQQSRQSQFYVYHFDNSADGNFRKIGTVRLSGVNNTDGNSLFQWAVSGAPEGMFLAVDDDTKGVGIPLHEIYRAAGIGFQ